MHSLHAKTECVFMQAHVADYQKAVLDDSAEDALLFVASCTALHVAIMSCS